MSNEEKLVVLKNARTLLQLLTVRQVIEAGDEAKAILRGIRNGAC